MSVVAGIEHGTEVWMAADSLISDDNDIVFETNEPPKVFEWGGMLLGAVGSFRVGNVIHEAFEPPLLKNEDPLSYMLRRFVPALRKVFDEYDIDTLPKVVDKAFARIDDWQLMVGLKSANEGRIYIVDEDFSVSRAAGGYAFIGSGGEVAAGALFATKDTRWKPETRIKRAVAAACKHVASVGGKIVVENI